MSNRRAAHPLRSPSTAFVSSGGIGLVVTALALTVWPSLAHTGATSYLVSGAAMTTSDLLLLAALFLLWRSPVRGVGRLSTAGALVGVAASAGVVAAEIALRINHDVGNQLFKVVGPVQALGLIVVGVGVVRAGFLVGWRRWPLLLTGLYVPLVLGPALAASGGENLPALGGFHLLVLVTGLAFRPTSRGSTDTQADVRTARGDDELASPLR